MNPYPHTDEPDIAPLPSELRRRLRLLAEENQKMAEAHKCPRCAWTTTCLCGD